MFDMNPVQIEKTIRSAITVAGTIAMTFGWLTTDQVSGYTALALQILGPVMTVGSIIWGLVAGKQANQVTAVAAMPEVDKVVLKPTAAGTPLETKTPPNVVVAR